MFGANTLYMDTRKIPLNREQFNKIWKVIVIVDVIGSSIKRLNTSDIFQYTASVAMNKKKLIKLHHF